jgi:hypothetical protein
MTGPSEQPIVHVYVVSTAGTGDYERYLTADGSVWRRRHPGDEARSGVTLGTKCGMTIREERR